MKQDYKVERLRDEWRANVEVQRLVLCGVRPDAISYISSAIRIKEIRYIHKMISPKGRDERQGRNIKAENISRLSASVNEIYVACIQMIDEALEHKFTLADAVSAAWRIQADIHGVAYHEDINGAKCEEMLHLYLYRKEGDVGIETCACGTHYLSFDESKCPSCRMRRRAVV